MTPITPNEDDIHLKLIIDRLNLNDKPLSVKVFPEEYSKIDDCFPNVQEKIKLDNGKRLTGWQVWKTEKIIEAIFHAIWESPEGDYIDITPKPFPMSKILFFPDKNKEYQGHQVDNIRINISGNALVDDLITISENIFKIENAGNRAFEYNLRLTGEEATLHDFLTKTKSGILSMLNQGLTKNQVCFCGKDKYKRCHGRILSQLQTLIKEHY